jgi:hypothetical protein
MIDDVDRTIAALLKKELPPELGEKISFATPDDQFPPPAVTPPAIDLFLYDIRENTELRSNEPVIQSNGNGTVTRRQAPVRVDFSYLVTAWPSHSLPDPAQQEHWMLGEVMRVLLRHRRIPEEFLSGVLVTQDPLLPTTTLHTSYLQSIGEFWQALGGKPKAALNYTVTVSVEISEPQQVRLVTEKVVKIRTGGEEELDKEA